MRLVQLNDGRVPGTDRLIPAWGDPLPALPRERARHVGFWADDRERGATLAVGRDGIAGLVLERRHASGRRIEELHVSHGQAAEAVLAAVAATSVAPVLIVVPCDLVDPPHGPLEAALRRQGFVIVNDQIDFAGPLAPDVCGRRPFTLRRFSEVGRRGLSAVLAAVWEVEPSPTGQAVGRELDELVSAAGADTSLWRIAFLGGAVAGAVLPLRLASDSSLGVLQYVCLLAHARGRGLGAALHREGLLLLRRAGAIHYADSIRRDNEPMRRILSAAGCAPYGSSRVYLRAGAMRDDAVALPATVPRGAHVSLLRKVTYGC